MKKRIFVVLLTLVMAFSMFSVASVSASAVTNAKIGSSSYCTVEINKSLLNKKGTQYAKVKLKTYDASGLYNTGAKVRVTLRDGKGNYITSWIAKGGDTLKLGDDHSTYRIYVSHYNKSGNSIFTQAYNFINTGKSYKWKISNAKNCTVG